MTTYVTKKFSEDEFDFLFKIVMIGDCGAGKTSVVKRFKSGYFFESLKNTVGVDFYMKSVTVDNKIVKNLEVRYMEVRLYSGKETDTGMVLMWYPCQYQEVLEYLQIWDTAGQERFRTITQSYYRSANGVIIVYDITKRSSFLNLQRWLDEVRRYTASNVLLILIGNKCDLETLREVEYSEVNAVCECVPEILFAMEVSAKENTNVEDAFILLATELKRRHDNSCVEENPDTVKLGEGKTVKKCSSCNL